MTTRSLLLLFAIGCNAAPHGATSPTTATGTVSGTVQFVGTPCEAPAPGCSGPLADDEVVLLATDAKTIVAKTMTGKTGNYSIMAPPGAYTIMTPAGLGHPQPTKRNDVTIVANTTSTLDLTVDTGVR